MTARLAGPRDSAVSLHGSPDGGGGSIKGLKSQGSGGPSLSSPTLSTQASGGSFLRSAISGLRLEEERLPLGAQHYELVEEVGSGMTAKVRPLGLDVFGAAEDAGVMSSMHW